ncbi:MAG: AAA-like domain-containing protein [Spirochaetota bacterium]|nr:AAA-like domain-containing protein [Spirochaetota bacterium]
MKPVPLFFNTTGPCRPDMHYMLPPADRLVGARLDRYISHQLYWVLHAPRQTGKTTFLQSWMKEINESEEGIACYVSVERCQMFPKAEEAISAICEAIIEYAGNFLDKGLVPSLPTGTTASKLSEILSEWAQLCAPKPLIVLFDEVDVLEDQAMVSFLRQLRGGFASRGIGMFPVSIALVGMRDLRDYLIESKDGKSVNPGSPFNIKESSISLSNFSRKDVHSLINQHILETGQQVETAAIDMVYDLTKGQPWLTNALAKKCHWDICPNSETITVDHIAEAEEALIEERAVHLDSLAERLKDIRIQHIVETILTGDSDPDMTAGNDFLLALDLGLVALENSTPIIANPIYREVIARILTFGMQTAIPSPEFKWENDNGTLNMDSLMKEFQKFWRRHADLWEAKSNYTEAFPHLLLMAFLQRVVNGGGQVEREFAAGRGRADLAVTYGGKWSIIEIKLIHPHDGRALTLEEGLKQISRYRDTIDPKATAYLVIFDRTEAGRKKSWDERLTREEIKREDGKTIVVIGG